jgi:hypothetical protein
MSAFLLTVCLCLFFVSSCLLFYVCAVYLSICLSSCLFGNVADPRHCDADPDPSFYFDADRIRIWILIKVIKLAITGLQALQAPDSAFGQNGFGSDADPDTALYMFVCMSVLLLACLSFLVQLACMETDVPIINRLKVYLNI